MKQSIQNKINRIKAASKVVAGQAVYIAKSRNERMVRDNLSKSLRNEKDALIFQDELENAVNKAHTAAVVVGQK